METINFLRGRLDLIDHQIAELLNMRMQVAEKIADWKLTHGVPIADMDREHQVIAQVKESAKTLILKEYLEKIYALIIECTKAVQTAHTNRSSVKKIGIIGLGLIGGSILKGLKAANPDYKVYALLFDGEDYALAKQSGLIDCECENLAELVNEAEILILATPIPTIVDLAKKIAQLKTSESFLYVMDVASVKESICTEFEALTSKKIEFVATHPMAGIEKAGFKNSLATLFINATWIIVPHGSNTTQGLQLVQTIVHCLGSLPLLLKGKDHDSKMALVSYLPSVISKLLWDFVLETDGGSLAIAGPGFRSMTRLAHENPKLRSEIYLANRCQIKQSLAGWLEFVKRSEIHE